MVILVSDDASIERKLKRFVEENHSMTVERVVRSDELGKVLMRSSHELHEVFVVQKGKNYYDVVVTRFRMTMVERF